MPEVENYEPIVLGAGDCPSDEFFESTFSSLAALEQATKNGAGDVECVHFSGSATGNTDSGEICVAAIAPADMPERLVNGDQVCCLFINLSGSMPGGVFDARAGALDTDGLVTINHYSGQGINATVRCSGVTLSSTSAVGSGVATVILDPTTCDFSQGIEICAEAFTDFPRPNDFTLTWCGCMICVQCPPLPLREFYVPRTPLPDGCERGLGDIAQIIHSINQLSAAFRCAGYTVECITRTGLTNDAPIVATLDADAKWFGVACTRVDWPRARQDARIQVNSRMGCVGRTVACNSAPFTIHTTAASGAEFVSIACGECSAGEAIWFGAAPTVRCATETTEEENNGVFDVTGETDALFFVFRKLENDLPLIPQLSSACVFEDTAEAITLASANVHAAAEAVTKIDKQAVTFAGSLLQETGREIVAPEPGAVVNKKRLITGRVQARIEQVFNLPFTGLNGVATGFFSYEIKCDGVTVHESPTYFWTTVAGSGQYSPGSFWVPICAFVECPSDASIELCMAIGQSDAGPNAGLTSFSGAYEGAAVCIL